MITVLVLAEMCLNKRVKGRLKVHFPAHQLIKTLYGRKLFLINRNNSDISTNHLKLSEKFRMTLFVAILPLASSVTV